MSVTAFIIRLLLGCAMGAGAKAANGRFTQLAFIIGAAICGYFAFSSVS